MQWIIKVKMLDILSHLSELDGVSKLLTSTFNL